VESNAVILTGTGLMPSGPVGPSLTNYLVANSSVQELTVVSVEVLNDVGTSFSLGSTSCLNFLLPPSTGGVCAAMVLDDGQATTDRGRLVVVMSDNTFKVANLVGNGRRSGSSQSSSSATATSSTGPTTPTTTPPKTIAPTATATSGQVAR
jgi:hypothetical protein